MREKLSIGSVVILAMCATTALMTGTLASAQRVTILYNFGTNGHDGSLSLAGLIFDASGNLYGTTEYGGAYGDGTVFELTPTVSGGWTEKVLHHFNHNVGDGYRAVGLVIDASGNLYGTTTFGGAHKAGTVFELAPTAGGWIEKILYSFGANAKDGYWPGAGLILDSAGNLYGTTSEDSSHGSFGGTVFELKRTAGGWAEQVLHTFGENVKGGYYPIAGLVFDGEGNLYGTTFNGGADGYGAVFELTPDAGGGWTASVLYSFSGNGTDGSGPGSSLIFDLSGNLYGTTYYGGTNTVCSYGCGTVFELSPGSGGGWADKVLHSFNINGADGYLSVAGLIFDGAGNLYVATEEGGTYDKGGVFKLTPEAGGVWTETLLYGFNGRDGAWPMFGALVFDTHGNLYGTTSAGGVHGAGSVFEIPR
jgi:uncharacterized repeat protein (TIGR03803 family)